MQDDPTLVLSQIASALADDDRARADSLMETIAFRPQADRRREQVPVAMTAAVFARDQFTCCYCGRRTIPAVVFRSDRVDAQVEQDIPGTVAYPEIEPVRVRLGRWPMCQP